MVRVRVQNHEGLIEIRLNMGTSEQGIIRIIRHRSISYKGPTYTILYRIPHHSP